jgi:predicted porin
MKKVSLVAGALFVAVGAAHAQSSVTLYGIIDEGFTVNTNMKGQHSYAMQSGVLSGSRWGLKGVEDIGGDVRVIFTLENGFDPSNGRLGFNGLEFGRQAFFGVSGSLGTLTLGRQYDPNGDFVGPFQASGQWGGNVSAHPADVDNTANTFRTNNAIKFRSASYGGFSFGGMYSLGGIAGDFSRNQVWSVAAGYTNGPLALAAGYVNARNPNISLIGNGTPATPSAATANTPYPVISGFMSARTWQIFNSGIAYSIGPATVGATYSNVAFKGLGDTSSGPNPAGYSGEVYFNTTEVNFKYQVNPALVLGAAVSYTSSSGVSGSSGRNDGAIYRQAEVGGLYLLSKRTDINAGVIYQKASGTDSRNLPAVASINNQSSPSSNDHQAIFRVGLRHRF